MSRYNLLAISTVILISYCGNGVEARGSIFDQWWSCPLPAPSTKQPFYVNMTVCASGKACAWYKIVSRTDAVAASADMVTKQLLAAGRQVVFVVHGLAKNLSYATWVPCLGQAVQDKEDSTVVLVDWGVGADIANGYRVVAANTNLASDVLYYFADEIRKNAIFALGAPYTYCIGHSIGAHVCGQASRKYSKFDRVTGLDPAGPGFDTCSSYSNIVMRATDGQCVDVIHTEGGGASCPYDPAPWWGTMNRWGQIDFYPNAGLAPQPHCSLVHTSHQKGVDYFIQSVKGDLFSTNGTCTDQWSLPASCANGNQQQQMGYYSSCYKTNAPIIPGVFYGTADVPTLACYIYFQTPFATYTSCNF